MRFYLNLSNSEKSQPVPAQSLTNLSKSKTVVASGRSESREPGLLPALDASKEGSECQVDTLQCVLKNADRYLRYIVTLCFDSHELAGLVVVRDRLPFPLPRFFTLL